MLRSRALAVLVPLGLVSYLACSGAADLAGSVAAVPGSSRGAPAAPKSALPGASAAPRASAAPASAKAPRRFPGGSKAVTGRRGVVVSVEAQATRAGVSMLEAGGNAVDAAVTVAFALAVTHPNAGNLGGGGFLLARPPGGPTVAVDFRETAPANLTRAAFDRMIAADARGPAAAGVPGTVAGLLLAHERFGKLPRARVLAPAIALARDGSTLGKRQARLLSLSFRHIARDPEVRRIFGDGAGAKREGARVVQPGLAAALERIAVHGAAGFYAGETAAALLRAMGREGLIRQADLDEYRAVVREPLSVRYRDIEIETMPPPSAGGVTLAVGLAALEKLAAWERPAGSAEAAHLFLEVSRRAQAVRRFSVVDPDSLAPDERALRLERWLDPTLLPGWPVDTKHATASTKIVPAYAEALRESENTTHLSVVDGAGFVVSCTVTLSASFGAKVMVPGAGFFLNNSVASFGTVGDNLPVPSRRTTSSMSPTLLLDEGQVVAVLGTPGGDSIPSTLVQLVRHLVDEGLPLDQAVDAPRFHHGLLPDEALYEAKYPPPRSVLEELSRMGHRLRARPGPIGDAHSIVLGEDSASGYADPREGGLALAAP